VARVARRERGFERAQYDLKHSVGVRQHIVVPEPQHAKPFAFEIAVTHLVFWIFRVLAAIDLDNQLPAKARKVHDIRAYRDLSLELVAVEPMGAQMISESPLCVGHIASKLLRLS
jgi:hypothetical protein